jgi:hypothetical protein
MTEKFEVGEDVSAPAVFDGLLDVPETLGLVFNLINEHTGVVPGDLCSKLLHN